MLGLVGLTLHLGRGQVGSTARLNEYEVLHLDRLHTHTHSAVGKVQVVMPYMVLQQTHTAANYLLVDTDSLMTHLMDLQQL